MRRTSSTSTSSTGMECAAVTTFACAFSRSSKGACADLPLNGNTLRRQGERSLRCGDRLEVDKVKIKPSTATMPRTFAQDSYNRPPNVNNTHCREGTSKAKSKAWQCRQNNYGSTIPDSILKRVTSQEPRNEGFLDRSQPHNVKRACSSALSSNASRMIIRQSPSSCH